MHGASEVAADTFEYLPTLHPVHMNDPLPAYFPDVHKEQGADPDKFLNLPAIHAMHGPPFGPVNPLLQVQLLMETLPANDEELVLQNSQPADPFIVLKVPASHSTQPAPFGPEYPLLQIQSVI